MYAICLTINDPPWATHLLHCELRQSLLSLTQYNGCLCIWFLSQKILFLRVVQKESSTKPKSESTWPPERLLIASSTMITTITFFNSTAVPPTAGRRHHWGGLEAQPGQPDQPPHYHLLSRKVYPESSSCSCARGRTSCTSQTTGDDGKTFPPSCASLMQCTQLTPYVLVYTTTRPFLRLGQHTTGGTRIKPDFMFLSDLCLEYCTFS